MVFALGLLWLNGCSQSATGDGETPQRLDAALSRVAELESERQAWLNDKEQSVADREALVAQREEVATAFKGLLRIGTEGSAFLWEVVEKRTWCLHVYRRELRVMALDFLGAASA